MHLTAEPEVILGLIAIVAGFTIYAFIKSRHLERMQQLQMGTPLQDIHKSFIEVKLGLLFIGIGIGILTAFILNLIFTNAFDFYPAFIFLFGGLGLLLSFFIVRNYKMKQ